jgi:PEP-CTERM motif
VPGSGRPGKTVEVEGLDPGFQYITSYSNGVFGLTAENNAVSAPEPGSIWLLVAALGVLGLARRYFLWIRILPLKVVNWISGPPPLMVPDCIPSSLNLSLGLPGRVTAMGL